ncbi:unnamed protein product [Adineta ricciae]|uniref:Uncharacterized protein n=1 Tax=Adineta ricciae TaxID=249248 RepID=A0A815DZW7_ADIRI|nr:unnamed protein product [Adineta ricciae]CAF1304522.1 unnamed protein product [Adineta ricciae]
MVLVRKRRGGRRHKKLKAIDPFYSGARKLLVDKKLVSANQAPKKGERVDNKVSHRFQQFLENKQHSEELRKTSKKKNKNKFKQEPSQEEAQFPELEQKPHESDRNYLKRLDEEAKFALDRARYESKYDVKLVNTDKNDHHQFEVKKEKSQRAEKRLKRLQAKKDDFKLKKEKKIKNDEFQLFQDKPKFGEIVHEPPTLTLPRRSKVDQAKAGMKDLLLKEKLQNHK